MELKHRLVNWLVPQIKYWGVKFEKELPPEFIITEHARQRMIGRFRCREDKIKKITVKAWYSREETKYAKMMAKHGPKDEYRSFMGHLFVFKRQWNNLIGNHQKILVTVYPRKGQVDSYAIRPAASEGQPSRYKR